MKILNLASALILSAMLKPSSALHQIKIGNSPREMIVISDSTQPNVRDSIQKAIDAVAALGGGVVSLQPGVFKIEYYAIALKIQNKSNISIVGSAGTIIKQNASLSTADIFLYVTSSQNITIQNIIFEGVKNASEDGDADEHKAIFVDGTSTNVKIEGCSFKGFKSGGVVVQNGPSNVFILNNTFDGVDNIFSSTSGDYGAIHLHDVVDVNINNNKIYNAGQSAISFGQVDKVVVAGNFAYLDQSSDRTMGLYVTLGMQNCIITDNQFYGAWNEGLDIRSSGSTGVEVKNNIISKNIITARMIGIAINASATCSTNRDATGNIITDNKISGFIPSAGGGLDKVGHGIYLARANFTIVSGNQISEAEKGINTLDCSSRTTISSNQIYESDDGITLSGRGSVNGNYVKVSGKGVILPDSSGMVRMVINNMITATDNIYRESNKDTVRIRYYCAENSVCDAP